MATLPVVEPLRSSLAQRLDQAGDQLDQLGDTNAAAGLLIAQRAFGRAPRVTGRLAGSVTVAATDAGVTVGSTLIYAGVVHWGWSAHHIKAQPWLYRAAIESIPEITKRYADDVETIIEKVGD